LNALKFFDHFTVNCWVLLADRGYRSVFAQLVSCIISLRTLDEVTLPTALALLKHHAR
jgi:endonuclease III